MLKCIVPIPLCCNLQTGYCIRSYTCVYVYVCVYSLKISPSGEKIFHVKLKTQVWIFTESFSCLALTNVSELVTIPTPQSSKLFLAEDREKIDDIAYWIVIMHEVNTSLNHIPTSLVDCTWLSLASHLFLHLQDQLDHGKNWFNSLEVKLTQSWVTKHDSCYNYNWWRVKNEQG